MVLSCDELRAKLAEVYKLIEDLSKPGIASVRDSDGSLIQYSRANIDALNARRYALEGMIAACCGGRTGPFRFVFP